MPTKKPPILYLANKRAGYDPKSRRWRTAEGEIISKKQIIGVRGAKVPSEFPSSFVYMQRTPLSDAISDYNKIQAAGSGLSNILSAALTQQSPKPMPIPTFVRSSMALSEFYDSTCGDVHQHIEAPIDIAMTDLIIDCPDSAVKKELELLYSPEFYDMWNVLYESWLSCAIYGVAFPLEVPMAKKIVMLPPRYVWVGYYVNYGATPTINKDDPNTYPYMMNPPGENSTWTEALVESTVMPMSYNAYGAYANEQIMKGWGLPLDYRLLHPIRNKAMSWQRYPLPPLSRAFNSLSSRVVLQEAIRATIEGIKNQLWVFHLGGPDRPATPKEVKAFTAMLTSASGDRTGTIVWMDPFKVEQHTPQNTDSLMANETLQMFTLNVFRDLGSSIRLDTGNPVVVGRSSDTGLQVDLSIWLKRMDWPRTQVLRWEKEFRKRRAEEQNSAAWTRANEKTTVRFAKSLLEVGELIKQELLPLYQIGGLSTTTFLGRSGYNYEAELANKKKEMSNDDKFQPRTSFKQATVGPDGQEKTTESGPGGRPTQDGTGAGEEKTKPKDGLEASVPTWDEVKKAITSQKSTLS